METSVGPTAVEYLLIGEFLSAPEAILEVDSYSSAVSIVLPALVAWNASQTPPRRTFCSASSPQIAISPTMLGSSTILCVIVPSIMVGVAGVGLSSSCLYFIGDLRMWTIEDPLSAGTF